MTRRHVAELLPGLSLLLEEQTIEAGYAMKVVFSALFGNLDRRRVRSTLGCDKMERSACLRKYVN